MCHCDKVNQLPYSTVGSRRAAAQLSDISGSSCSEGLAPPGSATTGIQAPGNSLGYWMRKDKVGYLNFVFSQYAS